MIWFIAWKNIWRKKTRSLVVITAIFLGMTGGIFSSAVMNGAAVQRIKEAIDIETSHIRVSTTQFQENNELIYYIPYSNQLEESITNMPWCEAASGRLRITTMANTAYSSTPLQIIGINPDSEKKLFKLHDFICDSCGDFLNTNQKNSILIGQKLATKLKLNINSKIVVTFQDIKGNLTGAAFRVTGIFRTNNNVMNEFRAFVNKSELASLLLMPEKAMHEMHIKLKPSAKEYEIANLLKNALPGMSIEIWDEIDPTLGMVNSFMDVIMYLFMLIILLALGFGIVNTMLMVVLERVRELGMLAAIGMTKIRIFLMIMLETILLSLTGGIAGMLASAIIIWQTSRTGIELSSFAEGLEAAGYSSFIFPYVSPFFFFVIAGFVIITGIIASILPARKAIKLNPAEAVRSET